MICVDVRGLLTTKKHEKVRDLCCCRKPYYCPWTMGVSGSMLLPRVMSAHGPTVDRVCGNVCGLCCYRRPCSYSWPGMLSKDILMFIGPAVRGHVGVSSPGCLLEPCFYLWALLPPGVRWRWVACVACWGDAQGWYYQRSLWWHLWLVQRQWAMLISMVSMLLETTLRSLAHADTLNNKKDTQKRGLGMIGGF